MTDAEEAIYEHPTASDTIIEVPQKAARDDTPCEIQETIAQKAGLVIASRGFVRLSLRPKAPVRMNLYATQALGLHSLTPS